MKTYLAIKAILILIFTTQLKKIYKISFVDQNSPNTNILSSNIYKYKQQMASKYIQSTYKLLFLSRLHKKAVKTELVAVWCLKTTFPSRLWPLAAHRACANHWTYGKRSRTNQSRSLVFCWVGWTKKKVPRKPGRGAKSSQM